MKDSAEKGASAEYKGPRGGDQALVREGDVYDAMGLPDFFDSIDIQTPIKEAIVV